MPTPSDASGRQQAVEILLILAVFFVQGGAPPPHVNETHYLTKAKHYWNPEFCPGDAFLDSADAHTTFYWSVGWLTRLFELPAAAWVARLAVWIWLAWTWRRLAAALTLQPWASVLAAALFVAMIDRGNFAGEWVVGGVEAKCIAYGFIFLGLAALARGRWPWVWVAFGAAAAFHVLVGGWAVIAAAAAWLADQPWRRAPLGPTAAGLLAGGVLSLAGLVPAVALTKGTPPEIESQAAQIYVFERLPHHLAPLTLKPEQLQRRLVSFGSMAAVLMAFWAWNLRAQARCTAQPSSDEVRADEHRHLALTRILNFAGAAVSLSALGLAVEWLLFDRPEQSARILRYYWFRQADVAVPVATALSAAVAVRAASKAFAGAVLVASLAFAGWHLADVSATRWQKRVPPAAARLTNTHDWQEACLWVRQHAPRDALFIVPWDGQSFKWYAHRADVINRKDIPQDAQGVVDWLKRRDIVFPPRKKPSSELSKEERRKSRRSLAKRATTDLLSIARQVDATHLIAEATPRLQLPTLYRNSTYAVYSIPLAK